MFGSAFTVDPAGAERVVWTLVHFLWQGAVIAVALAVALAWMRRRSAVPQARYVAGCCCLAAMALAPGVTFLLLRDAFDDPGPLVMPAEFQDVVRRPAWADGAVATPAGVSAWLRSELQPATPAVTSIWFIGIVVIAVAQTVRWLALQRAVRATSEPLQPGWEQLGTIPARLGLHYPVRFIQSSLVDAPATLGWLKPLVLLPAAVLSGMPKEYVEALVAHELAHVRRWDYLVNLLQTLLETLLFFHPAVWWVSNRVRDEREHCCDELAAGVSGGAVAYACALTALEKLRLRSPAFAMAAQGGNLWARVTRMVGEPPGLRRKRRRVAPAAVLIAAATVSVLGAQVFSRAVSTTPVRDVDDVRSLCGAVYDILGVEFHRDGDALWLAALDRALAERRSGASTAPSKSSSAVTVEDDLEDALLHTSGPDQLSAAILPRMTLKRPHAYQTSPDWTHGTYDQRRALIRELWAEARSLASIPGESDRAADYARAALLLCAQDVAVFGVVQLSELLNDPQFPTLARVDGRQAIRLQRHIEDHETVTKASRGTREQVEQTLHALGGGDANSTEPAGSTDAAAAVKKLDSVVALARGRPDLQWSIAASAQRLFRAHPNAGGVPKTDWARLWRERTPGEVHFHRWLEEAATSEPREAPPARRRVTSNELRLIRPAK